MSVPPFPVATPGRLVETPTLPPIVTGKTMRDAVIASLRASLGVVLPALEEISGVVLPQPVSWMGVSDFTRLPEEQSPAVYVTTPGISGRPQRVAGSGAFRCDYTSRVFIVVNDSDYQATSDRVSLYVAAVRTALLADPALGGLAEACEWETESEFEQLETDDRRSIGAGSTTVTYRRVLTASTLDPLVLAGTGDVPTATSIRLNLAAASGVDEPPTLPATTPGASS